MRGNKVTIGYMLSIIIQVISLLMIFFYGMNFASIAIFLFGALIILLTVSDTRKFVGAYAYALISSLLGLVVIGVNSIFEIADIVLILFLVNYAICFFMLSITERLTVKKVPISLPHTSEEKIKIGQEAEKIFDELDKLEAEIKKEKEKTQKTKVKKTTKKKAKKSTKKKTTTKKKTANKKTTSKKKSSKSAKKYSALKDGKTFHYPSCSLLLRSDPRKFVHYSRRQQALAKGQRPCRTCNP